MRVIFLRNHLNYSKDESANVPDVQAKYLIQMNVVKEWEEEKPEKQELFPLPEKVEIKPQKEKRERKKK